LADEELAVRSFAAQDQSGYDAAQRLGGLGRSRFVELPNGVFHVSL
jgi:hypothetical protein